MRAGKTLAENLESVPDLKEGQAVIMPLEQPIKASGHLQATDPPCCRCYWSPCYNVVSNLLHALFVPSLAAANKRPCAPMLCRLAACSGQLFPCCSDHVLLLS